MTPGDGTTPSDTDTEDPRVRLRAWLPANDDPDRPPMTLATVDPTGAPDARTVDLAALTDAGEPVFDTDIHAGKVPQLARDPRVAAVFRWIDDGRQLVVQGQARRLGRPAEEQVYGRIGRYLQILAWADAVQIPSADTATRRAWWARFEAAHPDGTLEAPPTWQCWAITPTRIVFWHSDERGPSTREDWRRLDGRWIRRHRAG